MKFEKPRLSDESRNYRDNLAQDLKNERAKEGGIIKKALGIDGRSKAEKLLTKERVTNDYKYSEREQKRERLKNLDLNKALLEIENCEMDLEKASEIFNLYFQNQGNTKHDPIDPGWVHSIKDGGRAEDNFAKSEEILKKMIKRSIQDGDYSSIVSLYEENVSNFYRDGHSYGYGEDVKYYPRDIFVTNCTSELIKSKDSKTIRGLQEEILSIKNGYEKNEEEKEVIKQQKKKDRGRFDGMSEKEVQFMLNDHIKILSSKLHENWVKSSKESGMTERIKDTVDEEWIKKNGTNKVDILNTSFEDLPSDWQSENFFSADVAMKNLYKHIKDPRSLVEDKVEVISKNIHNEWRKRRIKEGYDHDKISYLGKKQNLSQEDKSYLEKWKWATPLMGESIDDDNNYYKLPEDQKQKDREIAIASIEVFRENK